MIAYDAQRQSLIMLRFARVCCMKPLPPLRAADPLEECPRWGFEYGCIARKYPWNMIRADYNGTWAWETGGAL